MQPHPTHTVPTGLTPLDAAWGGFQRQGNYLAYGNPAHLRVLLLDLARHAADRGSSSLFVSTVDPKTLAALADQHLDFDLAHASRSGSVQLSHTPAALTDSSLSDAARVRVLDNLARFVQVHRPGLLLVDDLAPLARFEDTERFLRAFADLRTHLAALGVPFVFAADGLDTAVLTALADAASGVLYVGEKPIDEDAAPKVVALHYDAEADARWVDTQDSHENSTAPHLHDSVPGSNDGSRAAIDYIDLTVAPSASSRDGFEPERPTLTLGHGHYVAADETVRTPPETRPLAADPLDDALLGGVTVETRTDIVPPTAPVALPTDLFEEVDVRATLQHLAPPTGPAKRRRATPPPPDPRLRFVHAFDQALDTYRTRQTPFVAVALRMPPDHPAARRFHFVLSGLRATLRREDALLEDEKGRRAVWLMPDRTPDAARTVFAAIKTHLREATAEADHVMQNVTAAVVPNGHPFPNATEFLAHVYDEE